MVWSVVAGAAALAGIWLIQQSSSDGHPPPFQWDFPAAYLVVELLLAITLVGILRGSRWPGIALSIIICGTLGGSLEWLHRSGTRDFLIFPVVLWLLPWAYTAQRLTGRRKQT